MISIHIKFTHSLLIENHHRTTQLIKPRYRKIKMWSDSSVVRWSRTVRCLWSWGFCVVTETIQSSGDQLNLRGRGAHSASKPQTQGFVISAVAGFFEPRRVFLVARDKICFYSSGLLPAHQGQTAWACQYGRMEGNFIHLRVHRLYFRSLWPTFAPFFSLQKSPINMSSSSLSESLWPYYPYYCFC